MSRTIKISKSIISKTYLVAGVCFMLVLAYPGHVNAKDGVTSEVSHTVDSLRKKLLEPMADTLKAKTLVRLSGAFANENARTSLLYAFDALTMSYNPALSRREAVLIKSWSYGALGLAYERSGRYARALDYLIPAQEYLKSVNADSTVDYCKTLNTTGFVYAGLKKLDKAEAYYLQALELIRVVGNPGHVSTMLSNLGTLYDNRKEYDQAIRYFKLSLEAAGEKYASSKVSALVNLGNSYFESGQFDSSQKYVELGMRACEKMNSAYYLGVSYINAGKLAMHYNRLDEAERLLKKSVKLTEDASIRVTQTQALEALTLLYKKRNQFDLALKSQELLTLLKDSVLNEKVYQTINDAQITSEISKRDRKIALLNKDREIAESEMRLETVIRNSLMIGIVLALIVCFTLLSNVRNKRKANLVLVTKNEQIESQQKVIEEKNKELDSYNKELIVENVVAKYEILKSKINPHFLFNSLATLTTIVKQDQNQATDYIGRFSELYRRLLNSENQSLIRLKEEMEVVDYYLFLEKMRFEDKLQVNMEIDPDLLQLFLPPFCLQMMVENAIKHNSITNARKLLIKIYTEGQMVCVSNNLQRKHAGTSSTLTGQKNVIGRYALMTNEEPVFIESEKEYLVKLPLISQD